MVVARILLLCLGLTGVAWADSLEGSSEAPSVTPAESLSIAPDNELHEVVYEFTYLREGVIQRVPVTQTHYLSILVCPHGDTCYVANVWANGHAMRQQAIEKLGKAEQDLAELIQALEAYEAGQESKKP